MTAPKHLLNVVRDEHGDLQSVDVICAGVTSGCETWWECGTCADASPEQAEAWEDERWETDFAHGVEHRMLNSWCVRGKTPRCISEAMDDGGNYWDAAESLATGKYPFELDGSEEYVDGKVTGPAITEAVSA